MNISNNLFFLITYFILLSQDPWNCCCYSSNLYSIPEYLISNSIDQDNNNINICQTWIFVLDKSYKKTQDFHLVETNHHHRPSPIITFWSNFNIYNLNSNANQSFFNQEVSTFDILNPINYGISRFIPNCACAFIGGSNIIELSYKKDEILTRKLVRPHNDYFIFVTTNSRVLQELKYIQYFEDIRFKYGFYQHYATNNESNQFTLLNFCSKLNPGGEIAEIPIFSRKCPTILNGKHFRVTAIASPAQVRLSGSTQGSGAFYELLKFASTTYNFTFKAQLSSHGGASGFKKGRRWIGAIGEVFHREIDFGISAGMTLQRHHIVDPSVTVSIMTRVFFVKKPSLLNENWNSIFWPFDFHVWLAFVSSFIIIVPIYYGTKLYFIMHPSQKQPQDLLSKVTMDLLQIILEQDIGLMNWHGFVTKFLIILWIFFSLVIGTGYTGNLVSFLTSLEKEIVPRTHSELLLNSNSDYEILFRYYGGVAYLAIANSSDPIHKAMLSKASLVNTSTSCIIRAILGTKTACLDYDVNGEIALAANGSLNIRHNNNPHNDKNDGSGNGILIRSIDGDLSVLMVWIYRKYSPLVESFDKILLAALASGLVDNWFARDKIQTRIIGGHWLSAQNDSKIKSKIELLEEADDGPRPMNLASLYASFFIIGLGTGLGLIIFIGEIWAKFSYQIKITAYLWIYICIVKLKWLFLLVKQNLIQLIAYFK